MSDPFASNADTPQSFGRLGAVITPGASNLAVFPKAVVCLTGGDVTVVPVNNADGATLSFVGLPAGYIIPYRVRRVTAATAIVASIL
jgi:hypothetical protein